MQNTSTTWAQLISDPNHFFECRVEIDGISYGEDRIISLTTACDMFCGGEPTIGNAVAAQIDVSIIAPDIQPAPRASILPYTRVACGDLKSEWVQLGCFFADQRETTQDADGLNVLTLHGYDAMIKAEQDYPEGREAYPMRDTDMLKLIADKMQVDVDPRTLATMNLNYSFPLPADYTMREVLGMIASAYGGNFVMGENGKLRFIGLADLPEETRYLIDGSGNTITFGGDRIVI